jgi:hypothetical protein
MVFPIRAERVAPDQRTAPQAPSRQAVQRGDLRVVPPGCARSGAKQRHPSGQESSPGLAQSGPRHGRFGCLRGSVEYRAVALGRAQVPPSATVEVLPRTAHPPSVIPGLRPVDRGRPPLRFRRVEALACEAAARLHGRARPLPRRMETGGWVLRWQCVHAR